MLKIYLLKYEDPRLMEDGEYIEAATSKIDSHRRDMLSHMKKNPKGAAASIAAGLLIAYAYERYAEGDKGDAFEILELSEVMKKIPENRCFKFRIGEQGKPYFENPEYPYFNISHAGGYAAIALSDTEVGIDIQNRRNTKTIDMAKRFFAPDEVESCISDKSGDMFFKLWSRKEALGKCTGDGVRPYLDVSVMDLNADHLKGYEWVEKETVNEFLAVCKSVVSH
ncbi:MAG: 4'-phosphopantetheinyl transferase superfamily protein [Lachnospiraceae bacterium]|nr:4'-phosphopantetheinyl transferase superfamily protein [Lachnospiraceae bacterium]